MKNGPISREGTGKMSRALVGQWRCTQLILHGSTKWAPSPLLVELKQLEMLKNQTILLQSLDGECKTKDIRSSPFSRLPSILLMESFDTSNPSARWTSSIHTPQGQPGIPRTFKQTKRAKANQFSYSFVNRENRVPYYQRLFQEGGKKGVRQWNQVRLTPPNYYCSHSPP